MYPGTAFTRSIGDSTAEKIGVVAVPEVILVQLTPDHPFFVVASDGVFEFLSSQAVVDMVASYQDPRDACAAIAGESYKLWLEHENRTDDITIIVVHIKDLSNSGAIASDGTSGINIRPAMLRTGKGTSEISINTGSEVYRSVRSHFSDMQPSQQLISMDRSPAIIFPSPIHPREM
ncbi:hypothetical protein L1049_012464 [Liquidambar formosana]|uniref:PPM-type phosphatase domain-containing protein n=1 Tax=Liquidambar formosana TaxID=63359 RepID=A0AAP0N4F3_LIQFO